MCGRFTLTDPDPRMIRARFALDESVELGEEARYNIAPTDPVLAVRLSGDGRRDAGRLRWGMVPFWARGEWRGPPMINARAETLEEVPIFREAFEQRRCLIPADGFYEWQKTDQGKRPVWVSLAGGGLFGFAGLWASSRREDGERVYSCTIVTCEPNRLLRPIHDRMPVILASDAEAAWLDPDAPGEVLHAMVRPYDDDGLAVREVSDAVNDVRDDGPHLLEPPLKLF